jgi:hypothetical protein
MLKLDHLGYVAGSLPPLRAAFTKLGFALTVPRELQAVAADGQPRSLGQQSCHAVFAHGYLEFTAVANAGPTHHLAPWLIATPRVAILALGCEDAAAARTAAEGRGVAVGPVADAVREVDYGALAGPARFRWCALPDADTPESLVCFVEHRDAERVFQSDVQRHPNGARALVGLEWCFAATEFDLALARYAALLGVVATRETADTWRFALGRESIVLRRASKAMPTACAAKVVIDVADLAPARECLQRNGVPYAESDAGLEIAAESAGGAAMRLAVVYPRDSQIAGK